MLVNLNLTFVQAIRILRAKGLNVRISPWTFKTPHNTTMRSASCKGLHFTAYNPTAPILAHRAIIDLLNQQP